MSQGPMHYHVSVICKEVTLPTTVTRSAMTAKGKLKENVIYLQDALGLKLKGPHSPDATEFRFTDGTIARIKLCSKECTLP